MAAAAEEAEAAAIEKLDVNTATLESLAGVPGVGSRVASAIVARRETAPITSKNELAALGVGQAAFDRLFIPDNVVVVDFRQEDLPPVAFQRAALKVQTAVKEGRVPHSDENIGLSWNPEYGRYDIQQRGDVTEQFATEVSAAFTSAARSIERSTQVLFVPFVSNLGMLSEAIKDYFMVQVDDLVTRLEDASQRKVVLEFIAQHELRHLTDPAATELDIIRGDIAYVKEMDADSRKVLMDILDPANENLIDISPVSYYGLFTLIERGQDEKADAYAQVLAEHVHERTSVEKALSGMTYYGARALLADVLLQQAEIEGKEVDLSMYAWRTASVASRLARLTTEERVEAARILEKIRESVPGWQTLKSLLENPQPTYAQVGEYVQTSDPVYAPFAGIAAEMERFVNQPVSADESEADPDARTEPSEPVLIGTST